MTDHDFVLDVLRNADCPYARPGPPGCRKNPTYVPDDLMETFTPVLLIRNPLLFVPSNWKIHQPFQEKPEEEAFTMFASHRWVRILWDYFREKVQAAPIVVDAEDVIHNTNVFATAFCKRLGIEPQWQEVWDPKLTEEQKGQDPWNQALYNIRASGGIIRGSTVGIGI